MNTRERETIQQLIVFNLITLQVSSKISHHATPDFLHVAQCLKPLPTDY
jgi:hypothetical protein